MDNTAAKLIRIAKKSGKDPKARFTFLKHLLNGAYLKGCYGELKKGKAAGIDGRTVESYSEEEIVQAIVNTIDMMKANRYRPQPVRRVYIDKGNGGKRPLGIPTVMDKIIQYAVSQILEAIYEPIFTNVSYGYRPKRDAHQALKTINHMIMQKRVNYILEADIVGFFDHLNHQWLVRCLKEKIGDRRFIRLITQFLKAGVMEDGVRTMTEKGTPQGGILSPILSNIYLHYILDLWFVRREMRKLRGYAQLVRYADDFLIGFQYRQEAERVRKDLETRLGKFGLQLSSKKTRVIESGRFAKENRERCGLDKPETFDFLGFTHYCSRTRDGRFSLRMKTSSKRLSRSIHNVKDWLKTVRNRLSKQEIWPIVKLKLQGHYEYYGVSGNYESIKQFYIQVRRLIFKWMNRRSQRKSWNWEQFDKYNLKFPLPIPKLTYVIYNTW